MSILGPNLECVGLVPAPVDGECFCRIPDSPGFQYGECIELTVEVSNASTGLKCKWFAGINDMLVEQFKSSSTFFFEVKGDQNQVSTHNYTCTHTRAAAHSHTRTSSNIYLFGHVTHTYANIPKNTQNNSKCVWTYAE